MFHNMLITSLTPLSDMKEPGRWENQAFRTVWPDPNHHKPKENQCRNIKKTIKKKRNRTAYTSDQLNVLEEVFRKAKYATAEMRRDLSLRLNVDEKCIKVWFQNKRMKIKNEANENDSSSSYNSVSPPLYTAVTYTPQYYPCIDFSKYLTNNTHQIDNIEQIAADQYSNQTSYVPQIIDNYTHLPNSVDQITFDNKNEISSTTADEAKAHYNKILEEFHAVNDQHNNLIQNADPVPELPIGGYTLPSEQYQSYLPVESAFVNDNNVYPTFYYPNDMQDYTNCSEEYNFDAYQNHI